MYRFLKLSKCIINTAHITHISKTPNTYTVHFVNSQIDGFIIFGNGGVNSIDHNLVCHKETHTEDYAKLEQWIESCTSLLRSEASPPPKSHKECSDFKVRIDNVDSLPTVH